MLFLIGQWTSGYTLWCHNPLAVPVLLKYARNQQVTIQPWRFVQLDLPPGTHSFEVLSASGSTRLDSAEITLPATQESTVIYSIQGAGTYVLGEVVEGPEGYRRTLFKDQRILLPGQIKEPLLPGHQGTGRLSRWFEFAPTQRLVMAEEAARTADWSGMLHHARIAQRTFAPSADDPFLAFSKGMEIRALASLGRMVDAIQAARSLASAIPTNPEGAILAQNLLLNYLPPHVVEKEYRELVEKAPSGFNRSLLGRIEPDPAKARELLLEAMTEPACTLTAAEFLLQRSLWDGDFEPAKELAAKLIHGGTREEDDFLRSAYATCQLLHGVSPEMAFHAVEGLLPNMDEPLTLVPWLVASAARVGEVSQAMELLAGVKWGQMGGTQLGPPTLLYWKVQVLLEQKKETEARGLVEQTPRIQNIWNIIADLDTVLATLPPNKALQVYETYLKENHPALNPYRLAGYRLAHECGLDEIGCQILSPFSRKELGTLERVIWEILEGDGWPPERLLGFAVQHSPQETNDVIYALALRVQLDGDHQGALKFLDRCIQYPPVPEFPSVMAVRERELLR